MTRRVMKAGWIAAVAIALAAELPQGAAAEEDGAAALAWKLEAGKTIRYRYSLEQTAKQNLLGEELTSRQSQRFVLRMTVQEVEVAGEEEGGEAPRPLPIFRIGVRYEAVAVRLTQAGLGELTYDSTRKEDAARADDPAVRPFARLVGEEWSFRMEPTGRVVAVAGLERVRQKLLHGYEDEPVAVAMIDGLFGDATMRALLEQSLTVGPGAAASPPGNGLPVEPVERWRRTFERDVPYLGKLAYANRYVLGERVEVEGKGARKVTVETEIALVAPSDPAKNPAAPFLKVELRGGKGTGEVLFGTEEGCLLRSSQSLEAEFVAELATPEGGSEKATSRVAQTIAVERIALDAAPF